MNETEKKKELRDRLKKAFPAEWSILSEEQRQIAVDRFYEKAWRQRIATKELLSSIANKGLNFGLLFLGFVFAVILGLQVNILDRLFMPLGVWYQLGTPVLLVFVIWQTTRLFEESINEEYREHNFLMRLLDPDSDKE
jgi:hypothetical protein